MRLAVALVLLPAAALAQPADTLLALPDSAAALSPPPDSSRVELFSRLRLRLERAQAEAPPPPLERLAAAAAQATQPTIYAYGSTRLRVELPGGWDGPVAALEAELPGYALYAFVNEREDHPLRGATLRIERVTGLNQLLRERWMRGLTTHGTHGMRPTGPARAPRPGFAVALDGGGRQGLVVYAQTDDALWAIEVDAPAGLWAERRGALAALLAGVTLP